MTISTWLRITLSTAALCTGFTLAAFAADPALTIYNQDFAVVREILPLDLQAGSNTVRFSGATAHLEPDSVILRDPTGARALTVLEQNYRADPGFAGAAAELIRRQDDRFRDPHAGWLDAHRRR
jgi:hypothetical protein